MQVRRRAAYKLKLAIRPNCAEGGSKTATQRISLLISVLALTLMAKGFLDLAMGGDVILPGPRAMPLEEILRPEALRSGEGLLCMGIITLAALPALQVLLALVTNLRARAWIDALVALGVLGVLLLSVCIPKS